MPNSVGGPTPQEILATIQNALKPLGLRFAGMTPAYDGGVSQQWVSVTYVPDGTAAGTPSGEEWYILKLNRTILNARGHEQMVSTEYPARDSLPS